MMTIQTTVAATGTGQTDGKEVPKVSALPISGSGQGVTNMTGMGIMLFKSNPVKMTAIPIPVTGPREVKSVPNMSVRVR